MCIQADAVMQGVTCGPVFRWTSRLTEHVQTSSDCKQIETKLTVCMLDPH